MEATASEPTRSWSLAYESADGRLLADPRGLASDPGATLRAAPKAACRIQLGWRARHPLHALSESGNLLGAGTRLFARDHYEQFGTVTGEIEVEGRRWEVRDAPSFRDHSWGPRDWQSAPHNDFTTAFLRDGTCIVAFGNRTEDGGEDVRGIRLDDRGAAPITGFEVISDYAGEAELHEPIAVRLTAGGEEAELRGRVLAFVPLRHRSGDRVVRIGQALLGFDSPLGRGAGWSDFTRPAGA